MRTSGFTLIEIAIVLVVVGLILGMVFKGNQLIDQTRVKHLAAQYNKIVGAITTFYDRYGFYPGDGCTTANPPSPTSCTGTRNGYVDGGTEYTAFWNLLYTTGILTPADRQSVFGQPWNILEGNNPGAGLPYQTNWLDLPGGAQADKRIACALDRMIDDGRANNGSVVTFGNPYNPQSDCWNLPPGQVNIHLKVIP